MSKLNYLGILLYSGPLLLGLYHLIILIRVMSIETDPQLAGLLVPHPTALLISASISIVGLILMTCSFRMFSRPNQTEFGLIRLITVGILLSYFPFGVLLSIAFIAATSRWMSNTLSNTVKTLNAKKSKSG